MSFKSRFKEIFSKKSDGIDTGLLKSFEKNVNSGKLMARERINSLLDTGSFHESDMFVHYEYSGMEIPADGVIAGTGTINNRSVCIYAEDFSAAGSSLTTVHANKIVKIIKLALRLKVPLIGICDSGRQNLPEYVDSLAGYGEIASQMATAAGKIPLISIILGTCSSEAAAIPALSDFVFSIGETPKEPVDSEKGNSIDPVKYSSNFIMAQFYAETEKECFSQVARLLNYIDGGKNLITPAAATVLNPQTRELISEIIPNDYISSFDIRNLITAVTDNSDFFETGESFAPNLVTGFAQISGKKIGIVANQSLYIDGLIDADAVEKAAHFICFCNAFNLPIVTFVDTPGFITGAGELRRGIFQQSAHLVRAYHKASVLKITVIIRRAYGNGYMAMGSRYVGGDFVYAFPASDIAVMPPAEASAILFAKEISSAHGSEEIRKAKLDEYCAKFANPYMAAAGGYIDAVIKPDSCRDYIIHALQLERS